MAERASVDHLLLLDRRPPYDMFDGVVAPVDGALQPDLTCQGLGLELKRADPTDFLVYHSGPLDGGSK
jgi:hypothetical protein